MKLIFKPEDFSDESFDQYATETICKLRFEMSERANAKLEAYIKEHGKVVYGYPFPKSFGIEGLDWQEEYTDRKTHSAILINIKPIQTCTHPKEKVKSRPSWINFNENTIVHECECGAKVEPTSFRSVE